MLDVKVTARIPDVLAREFAASLAASAAKFGGYVQTVDMDEEKATAAKRATPEGRAK